MQSKKSIIFQTFLLIVNQIIQVKNLYLNKRYLNIVEKYFKEICNKDRR